MRVPRSVARGVGRVQAVHLHLFSDGSNIACSAVTMAIVKGERGVVKGLLINVKIENLETKHVHSEARIGERTDGS